MSGFWRGVFWEIRDPTGEERELHRLRAQIAAVHALHWRSVDESDARDYVSCNECIGEGWPCETIRALDAAVPGATGEKP